MVEQLVLESDPPTAISDGCGIIQTGNAPNVLVYSGFQAWILW